MWLADPGKLYGLGKIATSLGLQLQAGLIIDNDTELRKTLNIQNPGIIPVTAYFPHIITRSIRYNTLFPLARGISPLTNDNTVNNWQLEALFSSSAKSWSEREPPSSRTPWRGPDRSSRRRRSRSRPRCIADHPTRNPAIT